MRKWRAERRRKKFTPFYLNIGIIPLEWRLSGCGRIKIVNSIECLGMFSIDNTFKRRTRKMSLYFKPPPNLLPGTARKRCAPLCKRTITNMSQFTLQIAKLALFSLLCRFACVLGVPIVNVGTKKFIATSFRF